MINHTKEFFETIYEDIDWKLYKVFLKSEPGYLATFEAGMENSDKEVIVLYGKKYLSHSVSIDDMDQTVFSCNDSKYTLCAKRVSAGGDMDGDGYSDFIIS